MTPPTRSVREIAELVHTSPRAIERASVTEPGETFQEWRMQARTTKAKQLIIDGLPLDAIALHVGYSTASAF
ncbi:helix-turn-helix domain-containing protein [Corynebacterium sp.]|uniref:helix-turn-helix domain-containing protein n=1 Tax=Corynebacterium sp. TaxID=1720 RepID=UPI0026480D97|nr:helix-turn-helix domain-containing protein [Corynebacterium sp.]MDN6137727.1 helix-turn-helix domain-containing protein [Corynebacterium sp.]MDN6738255.1 helix-turn-helix domain-containing protein [Corynebacterium sp.]